MLFQLWEARPQISSSNVTEIHTKDKSWKVTGNKSQSDDLGQSDRFVKERVDLEGFPMGKGSVMICHLTPTLVHLMYLI